MIIRCEALVYLLEKKDKSGKKQIVFSKFVVLAVGSATAVAKHGGFKFFFLI